MTSSNNSDKLMKNSFLIVVILLVVGFLIYLFLHRAPPVPVKHVQALEKNEVFCNNANPGQDMNALLLLSRNMGMAKLVVTDQKNKVVSQFSTMMPNTSAQLKIKRGTLTFYASATNDHRYCEVMIEQLKVVSKVLVNK